MDSGEEAIGDDAITRTVRAQARKVYLQTLVTAALGTAVAMLVPYLR